MFFESASAKESGEDNKEVFAQIFWGRLINAPS
jgi:hypothetical protein